MHFHCRPFYHLYNVNKFLILFRFRNPKYVSTTVVVVNWIGPVTRCARRAARGGESAVGPQGERGAPRQDGPDAAHGGGERRLRGGGPRAAGQGRRRQRAPRALLARHRPHHRRRQGPHQVRRAAAAEVHPSLSLSHPFTLRSPADRTYVSTYI